ncbi:MAG: hypothetical protein M5U13_15675 [Thermoanaerobaculia bacterium]|nr:hypothetical protein [Thermoanaerobaculia bacterium]
MTEPNQRQLTLAHLRRRVDTLERSADAETRAQEEAAAAAANRARLEAAHPEFAEPSQRREVAANLLKLAVPVVWLIDIYLFGALAEYLASGSGLQGLPLRAAKYLLPGLLIGLDLLVASARQEARETHLVRDDRASRWGWIGWNVGAGALLAVYGALVWSTQWVAHRDSVLGASIGLPLALGLTVLTLLLHATLLFSGADIKAYALYSLRHRRAARREERNARRGRAATAAAVRAFNHLSLDLQELPQRHAGATFPTNFSRRVRELLRREFGFEAITPAGDDGEPPRHGEMPAAAGERNAAGNAPALSDHVVRD